MNTAVAVEDRINGEAPRSVGAGLLGLALILALAAALRCWQIGAWSLWEDEETTIYFSQNLDKAWRAFPSIFFDALAGLFSVTGVSVTAGRALAVCAGLVNIGLVYAFARRYVSRPVALLAALLLAINLGHLFWSQSVRYYTTVFAFQQLAMFAFFEGFERGKLWLLLAANAAFACALLTHFSALLLAPVLVGFLLLMLFARDRGRSYGWKAYAVFGFSMAAVFALFAMQMLTVQGTISSMVQASARDPVHVLKTAVAYFGVPVMGLALVAPLLDRTTPGRAKVFLVLAGFLPLAELVVITLLNKVNVTYYYGFFAVGGLATLAAMAIVALWERGHWLLAFAALAGSLLYYGWFAWQYHTTMQGDRPRWKDAAAFVSQAAAIGDVDAPDNPRVFATVPGCVAFHLGVPPGRTMGHPLVREIPSQPPREPAELDEWFVVTASHVTSTYGAWFSEQCELRASFEARTGPINRTTSVYQRRAGGDSRQITGDER